MLINALAAYDPQWLRAVTVFVVAIQVLGLGLFLYIVARRFAPLVRAQCDPRTDRIAMRLQQLLKFWLAQWKQPRYAFAGILHIAIFTGFLVLSIRSLQLVLLGFSGNFYAADTVAPGALYNIVKSYAATLVFLACVIAAVRRGVFKPTRYAVPASYGKDHTSEAVFVLAMIATLMLSEALFEASGIALQQQAGVSAAERLAPLTLPWLFSFVLPNESAAWLGSLRLASYVVHDITFFAFLCFLPLGKHFHVVTSFFNVLFAKLDRGSVKPVRWGLSDDKLDDVKSLGVKTFEDFTWKHILDLYSCADCGRCSDNCPANAAGRPLSPRFLTIKARDYCYEHFPVFGKSSNSHPLVGGIYSEDEIWSCTTCGACEEECPLLAEYIDKIVDLRRGMVDDGNVPKSLQKALKALEGRGNPYGKMEKKRAEWVKVNNFQQSCEVPILNGTTGAETLYFVDSITSYDDRIQTIGRATARILDAAGISFGILGPAEKDSGHDVRRFGEETLFSALRDDNLEAINSSGASRIVTSDPHAYNALKHDYKGLLPVEHISEVIARELDAGHLQFNPVANRADVYAYHDPCYLGRHNQLYDVPRNVLDAIPGLKRVEMERCRDRSFCCGGGGLMLFYEPTEDERMGVQRVRMAAQAGANVIVTACPFCMVNLEDAIKVSGMEGTMKVIDLTELVEQQLVPDPVPPDLAETPLLEDILA